MYVFSRKIGKLYNSDDLLFYNRCHAADTGGPSNVRDRRSHPFDNVLVEYEWFAAATHSSEVMGSSTSGRTEALGDQRVSAEVSTSGDHDESEEVMPKARGDDDPSLAVTGAVWGIHYYLLP
ncbi:hypothetical protein ACOSQ3_019412 [Xanthoceras sorbifolium]